MILARRFILFIPCRSWPALHLLWRPVYQMKRSPLLFILALISFYVSAQDVQLEAARKKFQAGDYAGAKAALTPLIESNPKNKAALILRGQSKAGLNDFYGAIGDYNFALETDSTLSEALNYRGEA